MTEIVVVPHTHWDREWYEPFQRFRLRLVGLLDEVLDTMEREPRYCFTLDGQFAAVDDYLEVRPENRARMSRLVKQGRLAVGPWQILLDEFLCSGETIVRNLERGMQRAAQLGEAMPVGYLPDAFGHCAQMPQILVQAGLRYACVWRGVPARVRTDAFAWVAPDGTAIRTVYLPGGYGNGAHLFAEPDGLDQRLGEFVARMRPWSAARAAAEQALGGAEDGGGPLLAMCGADHVAPLRTLADLIDSAAAADHAGPAPNPRVRLGTLGGYVTTQPATVDGLPHIDGELRSHARANILPGVISVRAHLKEAMSRAERMVTRYAEPFGALWGATLSIQSFIDMAWARIIDASGHDSVTGCGVDETAVQVSARLAEAGQLGQAVRDKVVGGLAGSAPADGYLVANPTPAIRAGLVELDIEVPPGDGEIALRLPDDRVIPAQTLGTAPTVLADDAFPADELGLMLQSIHGRELYGQEITSWEADAAAGLLTFHVSRTAAGPFEVADVRAALAAATAANPGTWRVRIVAAPRSTVAAMIEVPALGYTAVRPVRGPAAGLQAVARAAGRSLDNGHLLVDIADDGTLTVRSADGVTVAGAGRIVDGGDVGDEYNYAPPSPDRLVEAPVATRVEPVHDGPLLAALDIVRHYEWPAAADAAGRTADSEAVTVTTRVELRSGERFARLRVTFDNRCDDHRVRLHIPLPRAAESSFAEGQFAVVERPRTAEGGCGETPIPTFPAYGFVAAGGLAVLLEHAAEYELAGGELALTVLRSVGSLSRNGNPYRLEPAGPQIPTPLAQCRGVRSVSFGILPYTGDWSAAGILSASEVFRHDLVAVPGSASRSVDLPRERSGIDVRGEGVVMTSLRERNGWLELRLIAEHPHPTRATVSGPFDEARRADLLGRAGERLPAGAGAVVLSMRPWEIATLQLGPNR